MCVGVWVCERRLGKRGLNCFLAITLFGTPYTPMDSDTYTKKKRAFLCAWECTHRLRGPARRGKMVTYLERKL